MPWRRATPTRMETTNTEDLDRADMQRMIRGQDTALNDLMDRHATRVFHFLCRALGNEDDANDLAQETFVRVYQYRTSFRSNAKFTTWLFTIAANLARNHHRWRSRHPVVSINTVADDGKEGSSEDYFPSSDGTPGDTMIAMERAKAVRAAVDNLPKDMREAIILCEWHDLPVAEAATVMNATPKAVESKLYRARHLLRESLKKWL